MAEEDTSPGIELTISKIDAARRQLATGIELWFKGGDPVSIHTLVYAAYEIIHTVSKKRGRKIALLFDSDMVKEEYRRDWADHVKRHANFFKHADRPPDQITFDPAISEPYILFSLLGLGAANLDSSDIESAFFWWTALTKPNLLTDDGRKEFEDRFDAEQIAGAIGLGKADFLEQFLQVRQGLRRAGKIA